MDSIPKKFGKLLIVIVVGLFIKSPLALITLLLLHQDIPKFSFLFFILLIGVMCMIGVYKWIRDTQKGKVAYALASLVLWCALNVSAFALL